MDPKNTNSGAGRRKYASKPIDTRAVILDGHMDPEIAQKIFLNTLSAWGVGSSDEEQRDEILNLIAYALRQGTSYERNWSKVEIKLGGDKVSLLVLAQECGRFEKSENPVRVWVRAFGNGEVAVRMMDMLANPENVEIRQEACLDYQCTMDYVHLAFDCASAVVKHPNVTLTMTERAFISQATSAKVGPSRSMFIGANDGSSNQTMSAEGVGNALNVGSTANVSNVTPSSHGSNYGARSGFASLR